MYTKRLYLYILYICLALLLFAGCQNTPPATPLSSPLQSPVSTSVLPEPTTLPSIPAIRFEEPLLEGATEVSGTGPAGVPILIIDASLQIVLGSGTINSDGNFSIQVAPPLIAPNLIGIMLDEGQSSPYSKEQLPCIDRCRDQPMVGLLFDRVAVQRP